MNKLQRYYIPTSLADHASIATIGGDWCRSTDVSALEAENEKLLQLAADVLKAANWPDGDEICADLQDIYAKHGLMVIVNATEPCGENCACADWDAFPMECYRYCELLKAILSREQEKP